MLQRIASVQECSTSWKTMRWKGERNDRRVPWRRLFCSSLGLSHQASATTGLPSLRLQDCYGQWRRSDTLLTFRLIQTDYFAILDVKRQNSITWTKSTLRMNMRLFRASRFHQQSNLEVGHKPGKQHIVPDALSSLNSSRHRLIFRIPNDLLIGLHSLPILFPTGLLDRHHTGIRNSRK